MDLPTFFPISEIAIFECVVDPLLLIEGETKIQNMSGGHGNAIRQLGYCEWKNGIHACKPLRFDEMKKGKWNR